MAENDVVRALREALQASPENVPLRKHLGEVLLSQAKPEEAEKELRECLSRAPDSAEVKLGLAKAFYEQGKDGEALVLLEAMTAKEGAPAPAFVLLARVLLPRGERARAAEALRCAERLDPSSGDANLRKELSDLLAPSPAEREADDREEETADDGKIRLGSGEEEEELRLPALERPAIGFADVGGMEKLKEEIRLKIVHPLNHPDLYKAYGKPIGGGILLYGPPGCGKTYIARATAGEVKASFIPVGIHDVMDMYYGNSERKLHALFELARGHKPCVLFFDEVDALGASRADMRQSVGRLLINQFLSELDGVDRSNEGILVLAATNAPWHVDAAFRRPGRFDRLIFVPPPDAEARASILRVLLRGKPAQDVDARTVVKQADGFSGADLKAVVDSAIEAKLQEAIRKGAPSPLTTGDLASAAKRHRPTTREWFSTARNYVLYANEGGVYDDLGPYLKGI